MLAVNETTQHDVVTVIRTHDRFAVPKYYANLTINNKILLKIKGDNH